jgi:1,4-dihydroxy-2-naphthoate octaprenyltransferase
MRYNLPKQNAILIAICLVIIVIGLALMAGEASGQVAFNPDIFSFRRITVGPMIALFGFVAMVVAVLYNGGEK